MSEEQSAEKDRVVRHNHMTRDIKPPRQCPACDRSAHGCPCPRGDLALGRLDGVDMGVKRDAPLSFDPACPIHPGRVNPAGCDTCGDSGLVPWMIEGDPNCYQEPDGDGMLPCPDCQHANPAEKTDDWDHHPYDSKTAAEIVHDYAVVRGDLSEQYARDQLASIIDRRVERAVKEAEAKLARVEELIAPQWRTNLGYTCDSKTEAYAKGRNSLLDELRAALADEGDADG